MYFESRGVLQSVRCVEEEMLWRDFLRGFDYQSFAIISSFSFVRVAVGLGRRVGQVVFNGYYCWVTAGVRSQRGGFCVVILPLKPHILLEVEGCFENSEEDAE